MCDGIIHKRTVNKLSTNAPLGAFFMYDIRVKQINAMTFVDPRFEDEAISALMEEALSEDSDEQKFDIDTYLNGDFDYA